MIDWEEVIMSAIFIINLLLGFLAAYYADPEMKRFIRKKGSEEDRKTLDAVEKREKKDLTTMYI